MTRPNAWRVTPNLSTVEIYSSNDGSETLKNKHDDDPRLYAWAKRERQVYLLTNSSDIKSKYNTVCASFTDLNRGLRQQLIFYFIDSCFKKNGFRKRSRNVFFLPIENDQNSFTKYEKRSDYYINLSFRFTLKRRGNNLLVLIDPDRTITKDGNHYTPAFASRINKELFESTEDTFDYSARLDVLSKFKSIFGKEFKFELEKGSNVSFDLVDSIEEELHIIEEPLIDFGNGKTTTWPQLGLNKFGPLDFNESYLNRPDEIEVILISRNKRKYSKQRKKSVELLDKLNSGLTGGKYPYKGFKNIYFSSLIMGPERFNGFTQDEIDSVTSPNDIVQLLLSKVLQIKNAGTSFDICVIELVQEWKKYFDFNHTDLHDLIKAEFSNHDIKTQIITKNSEDNISKETLENLALGIYYKSGGNPWRLITNYKDVAYIGISFGFQKTDKKRLIGFAELFDCYGQFITLRSLSIKEFSEDENFNKRRDLHLTQNQFTGLIDKLLDDYSNFLDDNFPKNLVIHKTSYFNSTEQKIVKYYSDSPFGISLVHIQQNHHWHLLKHKEPIRGTLWPIKDDVGLLYTSGTVDGKYFQLGCPLPLVINLNYSDYFSLLDICTQLLELTKLNFNSNRTYSKDPVTLLHSRKIVNLLRVGMDENIIPKDPRFFL